MTELQIASDESTPEPLIIFISHKTKDKAAAQVLKDLLMGHCTGLTVFLSSDARDISVGNRWWETIHENLDKADWLLLLYTTPNDNWDWCIYEAGYFAGRRSARKTDTLLVLHPPGVTRPAPLSAWQSLPAEKDAIHSFFEKIFDPGNHRCHWRGSESCMTDLAKKFEMKEVAKKLADAVAPLKVATRYPNQRLTVSVPQLEPGEVTAAINDLPDNASVTLSETSARLLNLAPGEHKWNVFKQAVSEFHFDVETLVQVVALARTRRAVPSSLALFRSPSDNCGYRPLVYSLEFQSQGAVEVELLLADLPTNMDADDLNAFERVHRLFSLAKQFRREVAEKYGRQLPKFDGGAKTGDEVLFLKALLHDMDRIAADSWSQGFRSDDRLFDSFEDGQRPILEQLLKEWRAAKADLERSIASGACPNPAAILNPLRCINLDFLKLAATRMRDLVFKFVPPADAEAFPSEPGEIPPAARLRNRRNPGEVPGEAPIPPVVPQHPGTGGNEPAKPISPSQNATEEPVEEFND